MDSLRPISWLFSQLAKARVWAYEKKYLSQVDVALPVVSVGNLSVGGTGKTPVIDWIVQEYKKRDRQVGVVSRAYKAKAKIPTKVQIQQKLGSYFFGDEALWLAQKHPDVPVYVGSSKSENALALQAHEKVDLILIDDGFQHLRLPRKLNIVLLDLSQDISHYQVVPAGRLRESMESLARADFLLFTKAQAQNLELKAWFLNQGLFSRPHAILAQRLGPAQDLKTQASVDVTKLGTKALVVCGIADPNSFLGSLGSSFPQIQFELLSFPDHAPYSESDLMVIESQRREKKCESVWVTEKDAVKLRELQLPQAYPWVVCPLELQFMKGQQEFNECLRKILP